MFLRSVPRACAWLFAAASIVSAAGNWTLYRYGPFDVYTSGSARPARETLNELEQLRNAVGLVLGRQDLRPVWPIRVILFDSNSEAQRYPLSAFNRSRDGWVIALAPGGKAPLAEVARILVEDNTGRMPPSVETGLYRVFSTLDVQGTRVALGEPPADRTLEWALMHLLTVTPEHGGKARVFFSNLQQGADWVAAYHNAFAKTPAEIEAEADQYLKAGVFGTRPLSGASINPQRDFPPRRVEPAMAQVLLADLLNGDAAAEGYRAALNESGKLPEALEGLGMYAEAIDADSRSAACHAAYAGGEQDETKAREALQKAISLNPRWAAPLVRLAELESNPAAKVAHLKKATELEPRNVSYWQTLAEASLAAKDFNEAGRAWAAAERAATTDEDRERLRVARRQVETERTEHAERKQQAEQAQIQKLRDEMMARIREAEQRAKRDDPAAPADRKVVDWWDDPRPKNKASGTLDRVDCARGAVRLVLKTDDGKQLQFSMPDPSRVVVLGGSGEQTLACGPQKPPRRVSVEYYSQPDEKQKTAGEVNVVEFR
ncbi:MAG: hypothetical protein KIT09_33780 [Bryobacteraceae bacterium]|nr:hypothetical protein [Bryobacteraceae bacterium]